MSKLFQAYCISLHFVIILFLPQPPTHSTQSFHNWVGPLKFPRVKEKGIKTSHGYVMSRVCFT